jgi:2-iminobutanoate/2-iminopropanoate deaminase
MTLMDDPITEIDTQAAPPPRGTYSQGLLAGSTLHCATQLPVEPRSGALVEGAQEQARQALANLDAVCRAAGTSLDNALLARVYFVDRADWPAVEAAFAERFSSRPPVRVPVHVVSLALGSRVSIEATVACCDRSRETEPPHRVQWKRWLSIARRSSPRRR